MGFYKYRKLIGFLKYNWIGVFWWVFRCRCGYIYEIKYVLVRNNVKMMV